MCEAESLKNRFIKVSVLEVASLHAVIKFDKDMPVETASKILILLINTPLNYRGWDQESSLEHIDIDAHLQLGSGNTCIIYLAVNHSRVKYGGLTVESRAAMMNTCFYLVHSLVIDGRPIYIVP
jgi:hypothetical protein